MDQARGQWPSDSSGSPAKPSWLTLAHHPRQSNMWLCPPKPEEQPLVQNWLAPHPPVQQERRRVLMRRVESVVLELGSWHADTRQRLAQRRA